MMVPSGISFKTTFVSEKYTGLTSIISNTLSLTIKILFSSNNKPLLISIAFFSFFAFKLASKYIPSFRLLFFISIYTSIVCVAELILPLTLDTIPEYFLVRSRLFNSTVSPTSKRLAKVLLSDTSISYIEGSINSPNF